MREGVGKTVVLRRESDRDFFSDCSQDLLDRIFFRMCVHMKEHIEEGKFDLANICHSGTVVFGSNQFVEEFARHGLAGLDMMRKVCITSQFKTKFSMNWLGISTASHSTPLMPDTANSVWRVSI